jgi:hypothetical protein
MRSICHEGHNKIERYPIDTLVPHEPPKRETLLVHEYVQRTVTLFKIRVLRWGVVEESSCCRIPVVFKILFSNVPASTPRPQRLA